MIETGAWRPIAFRRRMLLVALVSGQTLAAIWLFSQSLPDPANGWTTALLLVVFGFLFAWISVGFWTAVFGFVALRRGGDPWGLARQTDDLKPGTSRFATTAVIMPICHEPVQRTLNGLRAIYQELEEQGHLSAFDFFVLSDSQDPEIWLEEQAACADLCEELNAHGRLFFRRRNINLNHKSGNIADFLRRWGRRYRYMVVLDADSLLSARCITRLVQLMESHPRAGIIQTMPRLARAETRFARLQQFANRCYGRLYGAGLAAIQLGEATYWGHNAIIRVAPFMRYCGLRNLQGPSLFRGPVLSHDFIEAALIGRAGYEVWLEPAIASSFEESPPTLEDDLIRDRRWCRGNLQHLWLLATISKLRLAHRMALVTGIVSYLASPLWLVFLGLSGYVALAGAGTMPALPGMLASTDAGSKAGFILVVVTATLLFGPRILAILDQTLASRSELFGGTTRLIASTLVETLVSLVLAPIRMFVHTRHVLRALLDIKVDWQGQNRTGCSDIRISVRRFAWPLASAISLIAIIQWQAPHLTAWTLPVVLPVLLVPLFTIWLARKPDNKRWLQVPEDSQTPPVIGAACSARNPGLRWAALSWFEQTVLFTFHSGQSERGSRETSGRKQQALRRLVARCAREGTSALSHRELSLICNHPESLKALHLLAWQAESGSPWNRALTRMAQSVEGHPGPDREEPVTQTQTKATRRREKKPWIDVAS